MDVLTEIMKKAIRESFEARGYEVIFTDTHVVLKKGEREKTIPNEEYARFLSIVT